MSLGRRADGDSARRRACRGARSACVWRCSTAVCSSSPAPSCWRHLRGRRAHPRRIFAGRSQRRCSHVAAHPEAPCSGAPGWPPVHPKASRCCGRRLRPARRGPAACSRRLGDRAGGHGGRLDGARLAGRGAGAAPAAHHHRAAREISADQPAPAARACRPRRRVQGARRHLRRAARAARGVLPGPAPVRRQRLARAAHAARPAEDARCRWRWPTPTRASSRCAPRTSACSPRSSSWSS